MGEFSRLREKILPQEYANYGDNFSNNGASKYNSSETGIRLKGYKL